MKRRFAALLLSTAALIGGLDVHAQGTDLILAGTIEGQTLTLNEAYKQRHKDREEILAAQAFIWKAMDEVHKIEDKYLQYLSNASSVMQNLQQIRTVGELVIEIYNNSVKLGKDIPNNLKGTAITALTMKLHTETVADCTALADIVDRLVTSHYSFKDKDDDKNINLLSAAERYTILQDVVNRLHRINRRLWMADLYIKSFSWRDLWFGLDRESWCKAVYSKHLFNDAISRWSKLTRK